MEPRECSGPKVGGGVIFFTTYKTCWDKIPDKKLLKLSPHFQLVRNRGAVLLSFAAKVIGQMEWSFIDRRDVVVWKMTLDSANHSRTWRGDCR